MHLLSRCHPSARVHALGRRVCVAAGPVIPVAWGTIRTPLQLGSVCTMAWQVEGLTRMCVLHMQNAGQLADPNWRVPPPVLPTFGPAASVQQEATPPSTPGQSAPGSPGGLPNGHAAASPSFRFGLPDAKYLSFAGPGGDAFVQGRLLPCSQLF